MHAQALTRGCASAGHRGHLVGSINGRDDGGLTQWCGMERYLENIFSISALLLIFLASNQLYC